MVYLSVQVPMPAIHKIEMERMPMHVDEIKLHCASCPFSIFYRTVQKLNFILFILTPVASFRNVASIFVFNSIESYDRKPIIFQKARLEKHKGR